MKVTEHIFLHKGLNDMGNGRKDRAVVSHLTVTGENEWIVDLAATTRVM